MKHTVRVFANVGGLIAIAALGACSASTESPSSTESVERFTQLENPDAGEGGKAKSEEGRAIPVPSDSYIPAPQAPGHDTSGGVGGLIGSKGTQIGSGGLGSRGSGLGGGGTAIGLGGLGTKGVGHGYSGYGAGGGNFGKKGGIATRREMPSRLQYTDHGVNALTNVLDDPMSTFAADVDTASYTNARRELQSGRLPNVAAVRVEEFVNYFDYPAPDPVGDRIFAVRAEAAPSPWTSQRHILRIGVNTKEPNMEKRSPVALTFLVDTSCSMSGSDRLPMAQRALKTMVQGLTAEDSVSLATYAGNSRIVLAPTSAAKQSKIFSAIDALRTRGGTAMGAGVDNAYDLAQKAYRKGIENRVVILSDGDANIGPISHEALLKRISSYADQGITLSTIGFGRGNYQDTLMEQFANKGDGNSFYVDSDREAQRVFGTRLVSTLQTVARDVKFQVVFNPDAVMAYRLIGYENRDVADKDFRNDAVDAGEVGVGHAVTALYELVLRDAPKGDVAQVHIRHKMPGKDTAAVESSYAIPQTMVRDEWADVSDSYRVALAAAAFAEKLRASQHVEELRYSDIAGLLNGKQAPKTTEENELLSLIRKAERLSGPELR